MYCKRNFVLHWQPITTCQHNIELHNYLKTAKDDNAD